MYIKIALILSFLIYTSIFADTTNNNSKSIKNIEPITKSVQNPIVGKPNYSTYFNKNTENYYVKVDGITEPIQLIQMTGIPYVKEIESLSDTIKLLHATAGGQGTHTIVDFNYTFILDMKEKSVVGFLEYDEWEEEDSLINRTPTWQLKKDLVIATHYDEDEETYTQTKFKLTSILEIKDADEKFQKQYTQLKSAIKKKDIHAFYYSVSVNFSAIGAKDKEFNNDDFSFPVQNFIKYFIHKNESNAYTVSWEGLASYFQNNTYIKREKDLICLPSEESSNQKKLDSFLCFKKYKNDYWLIQSLILNVAE